MTKEQLAAELQKLINASGLTVELRAKIHDGGETYAKMLVAHPQIERARDTAEWE